MPSFLGVSVNALGTAHLPRALLADQQQSRLTAVLKQTEPLKLQVPQPRLIRDIPLSTAYDADLGLLNLVWGPLQTDEGHLAPDGLSVEIEAGNRSV